MNTGLLALLFLSGLAQDKEAEGQPRPDPPGRTIIVGVAGAVGRRVQHVTVIIPDPTPPVDRDDDEDQPPPQPLRRISLKTAVILRDNFDRWLFEDLGDESARARRLQRLLEARVDAIAPAHRLNRAQRAKLLLAGRGDIKRLFDQVEDRRREFEAARSVYANGLAVLRRLEPYRQAFRDGPFGYGSLFAKTLQRIDDEQGAGR